MTKVQIFDPALCCPTGVCGPSVDPELTRVATAIFLLEKKGFDITRYNLATEPGRFVENTEVNRVLHEQGPDALPVSIVDGKIAKISIYPTNEEFSAWFGVEVDELSKKQKVGLKIDLK
ncbi:arsenite efflux transporter metallochaperone ArsD [Neobacillus niacini]|uniref:arsenite efflux transporter metallochaperone ArsD n=1 Tax=Neobacillus niacini TaxID=86668 RepID=UPI0021CB12C8|nr:arsenite efflux transporter metallochaperone ArsD [Neobacillus niacini]MCM3767646.1 arsenite efflux transporter metallochaperone ArsD [Neobacillus niacini]